MYELKKMERYLRVNLLGPGPRLMKEEVSQGLRNTGIYQVLFVGRVIVNLEDGTDTLSRIVGNYQLTLRSIPERRKHKIPYRLLSVMAQV